MFARKCRRFVKPITKIQRTSGPSSSSPLSWTQTPAQNNLLLVFAQGTNNHSNASIDGWTKAVGALKGSTAGMALFYKIAGASEGSVTLTWTGSTENQLMLAEYTGIRTSSPLDKTAFSDNTGSVSSKTSGTTETTTYDHELIVAFIGTGSITSSQSWSNGFTDEYSPDNQPFFIGTKIVSTKAAYETTLSWTTARVAGGLIATFIGGGL